MLFIGVFILICFLFNFWSLSSATWAWNLLIFFILSTFMGQLMEMCPNLWQVKHSKFEKSLLGLLNPWVLGGWSWLFIFPLVWEFKAWSSLSFRFYSLNAILSSSWTHSSHNFQNLVSFLLEQIPRWKLPNLLEGHSRLSLQPLLLQPCHRWLLIDPWFQLLLWNKIA